MKKLGLLSAIASLLGDAGEEVVRAAHNRRRNNEGKKGSQQNTFNIPSLGKLKRASGRMTKGRREMQKQLASGREIAPSEAYIVIGNF